MCHLACLAALVRQYWTSHLQHHLARRARPSLSLQERVCLASLLQWECGADKWRAQGAAAEQACYGAQLAAVGVHTDEREAGAQAQDAFE